MDDMVFPSYVSSKARTKQMEFGESKLINMLQSLDILTSQAGDAMVREVDLSRITVRLVEKSDRKGEADDDHVVAKLSGDLLPVLQRCLVSSDFRIHRSSANIVQYTESVLNIGSAGDKVTVLMKYLPINMRLDPSESMNNMGSLRVDILDAADLPSADRNGFSDPYCKFELNGESVYKSKVQKKTLHPAWNEFFETPIPSRTAAKFNVKVMDWDFGDKADFLGEAGINLEMLEPMLSQEITLTLDGKKGPGTAGVIRLRLLFKASYVTRSRQGSSTFSGTIGPAGKVLGAPVKGVGKVGSTVGGGLVKGATFMRHGFKSGKTPTTAEFNHTNGHAELETPLQSVETPTATPPRAAPLMDSEPQPPSTPTPSHGRSPSIASKSAGGTPGGSGETGTAEISILSAKGYPPGTKVQVYVKQLAASGSKSAKELLKTKAIKCSSPDSPVNWDSESVKVNCAPDAQFQIQVKDHGMFGGEDLGETLFHIDDSGSASEKAVNVGGGTVIVKSRFQQADVSSLSASSSWKGNRRSFLSKRDSRQSTPS